MPTVEAMTRPGIPFFVGAAVAGLAHAAASLYWTLGGTWLLDTVGAFAVRMQEEGGLAIRAMLAGITVMKIAGALVPLVDHLRPPAHRWVRVVSWLGVAVLVAWGGMGMLGSWYSLATGTTLVTSGEQAALVGHAFLWDPLFVVWGVLLGVGLLRSRGWWRAGVAS